jgi:hypothetical protein
VSALETVLRQVAARLIAKRGCNRGRDLPAALSDAWHEFRGAPAGTSRP